MSSPDEPHIEVEELEEGVLLARIRTDELGLFETPLATDLGALVGRAETDESIRAVVLTGTHPGRFVSHASVDWLQRGGADTPSVGVKTASKVMALGGAVRKAGPLGSVLSNTPLWGVVELERLHHTLLTMNSSGVIYVAAMNGSALGFGSELAWACDLRFMAEGEHFIGQPEILLGFNPGGGGTQRLTRLVGSHRALKAMLDGGPIPSEEALHIGALDEIVPAADLIDRSVGEARRLGRRTRGAVAAVKRSVYFGGSMPLDQGIRLEQAEFLAVLGSPEAQALMLDYEAVNREIGGLQLYSEDYPPAAEAGRLRRPREEGSMNR